MKLTLTGAAMVVVLATTMLCTVGVRPAAADNAPITVTTAVDSGPGSLRQAILDANAQPGADSIIFAIPGDGIHVITLDSALPTITDPLSIDARTQPGWTSSPLIELDEVTTGGYWDGFDLDTSANGSSVAGIDVPFFSSGVNTRTESVSLSPTILVRCPCRWSGVAPEGLDTRWNQGFPRTSRIRLDREWLADREQRTVMP